MLVYLMLRQYIYSILFVSLYLSNLGLLQPKCYIMQCLFRYSYSTYLTICCSWRERNSSSFQRTNACKLFPSSATHQNWNGLHYPISI